MTLEDRYRTATPEGVALDVVLAGLGSRFIAVLLDSLIQAAALLLYLVASDQLLHGETGSVLAAGGAALFTLVDLIGYFVICEMLFSGQSIGKMAAGLRVVRVGGGAIGFWSSLLRNVLRLVDWIPGFYLVGCVLVLATPRNQRLGDLAGGTLVIRERVASTAEPARADLWSSASAFGGVRPTWTAPGTAGGWALPPELSGWDVSAVPDSELALVRRFMENRHGYTPEARTRLATDLANRIWPYVSGPASPDQPEAFLETLLYVKSARS